MDWIRFSSWYPVSVLPLQFNPALDPWLADLHQPWEHMTENQLSPMTTDEI
jgi:hypothetical protein